LLDLQEALAILSELCKKQADRMRWWVLHGMSDLCAEAFTAMLDQGYNDSDSATCTALDPVKVALTVPVADSLPEHHALYSEIGQQIVDVIASQCGATTGSLPDVNAVLCESVYLLADSQRLLHSLCRRHERFRSWLMRLMIEHL
jgi:hypothetical protein